MSPEGRIAAEHIWKRFRRDRPPTRLKDIFERARPATPGGRWRWALRDVDLVVEHGEAVGLVGVNGSGKSTLLKILNRIMYPEYGRLEVRGRVGALIEVRSGIHPQLSGRENIFLYGSLLGLTRRQVAERFDEIVEFAGVAPAIDRQVKFYSTGMQMRLGFAVAAFLEPDVLLVDEVLAVGDTSFQQRCLDRMRTVLGMGTTLVFVSHDLAAVEAVCTRGVWIDDGEVRADGSVGEVLSQYRTAIEEAAIEGAAQRGPVRLTESEVGMEGSGVAAHRPLPLRFVLESDAPVVGNLCVGVSDGPSSPFFVVRRDDVHLRAGTTETRCTIEEVPLGRGVYYVWFGIYHEGRELLPWQPAARVEIGGASADPPPRGVMRLSPVHVRATWEIG